MLFISRQQQRRLTVAILRVVVPLEQQLHCCTTTSRSNLAAQNNGVRPWISLELTSTSSRSSRSCATISCPDSAAHDSGERPFPSLELVSMSLSEFRIVSTRLIRLYCYARCSNVVFLVSNSRLTRDRNESNTLIVAPSTIETSLKISLRDLFFFYYLCVRDSSRYSVSQER